MIIDTEKFKDMLLFGIRQSSDSIFRSQCTNLLNMIDSCEKQYKMWCEEWEKKNGTGEQ